MQRGEAAVGGSTEYVVDVLSQLVARVAIDDAEPITQPAHALVLVAENHELVEFRKAGEYAARNSPADPGKGREFKARRV